MTSNLSQMSVEDVKMTLAVQLLMDDDVRQITGPSSSNIDFMTKLLMDYHKIDPKAVMGAQHMVDFLKDLHVGPREFNILRDLTQVKSFNVVLLTRAVQLGLMTKEEITDRFWKTHENGYEIKPFDFIEIEGKIRERNPNLTLNQI